MFRMFVIFWTCLKRKKCLSRLPTLENIRLWKDLILLYVITFLVVMPTVCLHLHNTVFDVIFHTNQTQEKTKLFLENSLKLNQSIARLQAFDDHHRAGDRRLWSRITGEERSEDEAVRVVANKGIAITVITVMRNRLLAEKYNPGYLTQTVSEFLHILNSTLTERDRLSYQIHFSICNVDAEPDKHVEVTALPDWVPVVKRFPSPPHLSRQEDLRYDALLNKEKEDYVFCIDKSLEQNLSHVLVVEDDAVPRQELLSVIDSLVLNQRKSFVSEYSSKDVTFYKLYHPDRLLGYISLEVERLPELFSLGFILSCFLTIIYHRCLARKHCSIRMLWCVFFIYSCLVVLCVGRTNISEIRRVSKFLYQTTPSPSCCTPAILFPRRGAREVSEYLKTVTCKSKFGKDMAIEKLKEERKLLMKQIQPNLFKHIGLYSSLRSGFINPFIV